VARPGIEITAIYRNNISTNNTAEVATNNHNGSRMAPMRGEEA